MSMDALKLAHYRLPLAGHKASEVAAAFEWLRGVALAPDAPPGAGIVLEVWSDTTRALLDRLVQEIEMGLPPPDSRSPLA